MSLVNEALQKVRMEAVRREVAGGQPRTFAPAPRRGAGPWLPMLVGMLVVALLVAGVVGAILINRSMQAAAAVPRVERPAAAPAVSASAQALPAVNAALPASNHPETAVRAVVPETLHATDPVPPSPAMASTPAAPAPGPTPLAAAPTLAPPGTSAIAATLVAQPASPPVPAEASAPAPMASTQPAPMSSASEKPAVSATPAVAQTQPQPPPPPAPAVIDLQTVDVPGIGRLRLTAVARSPIGSRAVINGAILAPGDQIGAVTIVEIEDKRVRLSIDEKIFTLKLP